MSEKTESNVPVREGDGRAERTSGVPARSPFVDIYETADGLTVVADLPGVPADAVQVQVERGVLTLVGRASAEDLSGWRPIHEGLNLGGEFFRAFALSDEVDREKITARLANGVLTVVLPKAPQARTRKIPIQGA
jgi:HSP20 family molecular chaperone IbpA